MSKKDQNKTPFEIQWQIIKKKNKQDQQKTKLIFESIRLTQQKSAQTQKKIQDTLQGVKTTMGDIKTTNDKIDNFKKQYSDALGELAKRCFQNFFGISNPLKKNPDMQYQFLPTNISIKQAVLNLLNYDNILFITGAGISAASGIPTFRGPGGLYTQKIKNGFQQYPAQQVLTKSFYNKKPDIVWQWLSKFQKLAAKSKPNQAHYLIDQCCKELIKKKKSITLVTQNLDNLHIEPVGYKLYHIHGDIKYIRCEKMHLSPFSLQIDKCPQCGGELRPHILFFDEQYGGLYGGQVKDKIYDFVVVIGTMLETNLVRNFVSKAKQVIQINLQPVIEVGKIYPFKGDAKQTLKQLLYVLKSQ